MSRPRSSSLTRPNPASTSSTYARTPRSPSPARVYSKQEPRTASVAPASTTARNRSASLSRNTSSSHVQITANASSSRIPYSSKALYNNYAPPPRPAALSTASSTKSDINSRLLASLEQEASQLPFQTLRTAFLGVVCDQLHIDDEIALHARSAASTRSGDQFQRDNVLFYQNRLRCRPDNAYIEDILTYVTWL